MTPIQTQYGGQFFRTRGEARFAVFFDACQLHYEYEKEGFWLEEGGKYLPDFFGYQNSIAGWKYKSELPKPLAILKCHCLADETQKRVVMTHSSPGLETLVACFSPGWNGHMLQTVPAFFMQWLRPEVVLAAIQQAQSARFEFGETPNVVPLRLTTSKPSNATLPF